MTNIMPMQVYKEIIFENKKEKGTKFYIIPIVGQKEKAISILNLEIENYINTGIHHNRYIDIENDNQFVQIIIEQIN